MRRRKSIIVFATFFTLLTAQVYAGEIAALGGWAATNNPINKTYTWQLQYMEGLGEYAAFSLSYLNQGHFISHHRDANTASLWLRAPVFDKRLTLGIGGGGLFFYDTIIPKNGAPPSDFHGWGTIVSAAATIYTDSRLFAQVQGNWVRGGSSFDTLSIMAGLGFQLDAPPEPGPDVKMTKQQERTTDNEVTFFGGQTIVNIPEPHGKSPAYAIEYRRGIWKYLEWTARGLYEGNNALINRYGVTSQLWLEKEFLDDSFSLGAGLGGYYGYDQRRSDRYSRDFFAYVASITTSIRLTRHWDVRATWDRTITGYNRDTDIFLGGLGYRF